MDGNDPIYREGKYCKVIQGVNQYVGCVRKRKMFPHLCGDCVPIAKPLAPLIPTAVSVRRGMSDVTRKKFVDIAQAVKRTNGYYATMGRKYQPKPCHKCRHIKPVGTMYTCRELPTNYLAVCRVSIDYGTCKLWTPKISGE